MDFSILFSWQTILLALIIYAITLIPISILETTRLKNKVWYESGVKPILPVILGACLGLIPEMVSFIPFAGLGLGLRCGYCAVCGLFSGWSYTHVKDIFKNFGGTSTNTDSPPQV